MIDIKELNKEIEEYKKVAITGDPNLLFLIDITPEAFAKEYTKKEWKPLAELLEVKTSGKELTVAKAIIKAYKELL